MKQKIADIFVGNIKKETANNLPFTPRERYMVKWFIKFEIMLIITALSWTIPVRSAIKHYYEFSSLKQEVIRLSTESKEASASTTPDVATSTVTAPIKARVVDNASLIDTDAYRDYVDNLSVKRNNPGNLRYARQAGATNDNGFARFDSARAGMDALIRQITLYQERGNDISSFIYKYAPPRENDTERLITEMCSLLKVKRDASLSDISAVKLAVSIVQQEHSVPAAKILGSFDKLYE